MNKTIIGIILAVIIIAGIFYFGQRQYQPAQRPAQQPAQPTTKIGTNMITIQNFAFNPQTLTVKKGTKVTWTNEDSAVHTIKSDTFKSKELNQGDKLNSQNLNQGDKYEFTFNDKGSFDYSCGIHPYMKGKIVVE